jgi:hypothetical protein
VPQPPSAAQAIGTTANTMNLLFAKSMTRLIIAFTGFSV